MSNIHGSWTWNKLDVTRQGFDGSGPQKDLRANYVGWTWISNLDNPKSSGLMSFLSHRPQRPQHTNRSVAAPRPVAAGSPSRGRRRTSARRRLPDSLPCVRRHTLRPPLTPSLVPVVASSIRRRLPISCRPPHPPAGGSSSYAGRRMLGCQLGAF
jgi:hypothetical protein